MKIWMFWLCVVATVTCATLGEPGYAILFPALGIMANGQVALMIALEQRRKTEKSREQVR
jgi:hypothetical protein